VLPKQTQRIFFRFTRYLLFVWLWNVLYCLPLYHRCSILSSVAKKQKKPARIPPQTPPPRGQNVKTKISRGFAKSFPPENSFGKTESAFRPANCPSNRGQNPERKTPFPFSKEISPSPNQKCKECFFFRGFRRVREAVAGHSSSVRFNSEPPRAPRVRHQSGFCWK